MRPILCLLISLQLLAATAGAQPCPQYEALLQNARSYWGKGDFDKALKQLTAAREHCPGKGAEVDAQFIAFTREIAGKYKEAETQKINALQATAKANREAEAARAATASAEHQALRAYANDLAYKSTTALRDRDRNTAFRLAEFAHRYVEADNPNVVQALIDALYYYDNPDPTHPPLPRVANLEGHSSYVRSVAFSPDGKRLATGAQDNTAKIWELSGDALLQRWQEKGGRAGLILRQLQPYNLDALLDQHPGNEQKLIATGEVWQIKAFADLAAAQAGGSSVLARVAPLYARAERLYAAALALQDELLIRMDYAKMLRRWAEVYQSEGQEKKAGALQAKADGLWKEE